MSIFSRLAATSILACALAAPSFGALALDFTAPTIDDTNGAWSLGWEFTLRDAVTVTALGFYDDGQNDLTESHGVVIYDLQGNPLVSGTVNPGDPLLSWWRWTSVTPTLLPAGSYIITAATGSENYTWDPTGFVTDPLVTYVRDRYIQSATPDFPSNMGGNVVGYFGPNFQFDGAAVPEPSTYVLMAGGLAALSLLRRRRA